MYFSSELVNESGRLAPGRWVDIPFDRKILVPNNVFALFCSLTPCKYAY